MKSIRRLITVVDGESDDECRDACDEPEQAGSFVTAAVSFTAHQFQEMAVFGLRYAAMDFLVDNDGVWFFVDLNPNGQFGFVPDLRDPIATALANLLEGVPR
ncbi:hypothetical protein ADK60_05025 [Streptomyces sp. XY431]|uniref:hypothetical protein n=1 Tax=Streptomyces sp. XY431 TaxID=1415562 RepID=UPI0006C49390|nr:hypothetical protein [Streptomyces sp. XY431]KOV37246.1 hypothetical protein ADK60_05025 [Streptomyces sp. XY431]